MGSENIFVETILQLAELLRKRSVSPVEVTQKCLARIEQLNPTLNAFLTVTADSALTQARQAEAEIMRGEWRGPLHGIPIGLKDLIDTAGVKTTAGSQLFKDRVPTEDAEIVRRLRAAGVVLLGKQNLHEFAYGGSSIISYFGEVRNPWNATHIAGGSSGGSAAAVASGMGYAAIGTDTAVAGTADPAPHRHQGRGTDIDCVGTKTDDLGNVGALPDAPARDDGDLVPDPLAAQFFIHRGYRCFDRDSHVVPEDHRRSPRSAAEPINNYCIGR